MHPQIAENLGPHPVVAQIGGKAKPFVGLHRVKPAILQGIGPKFVDQADPPALLPQIHHHALSGGLDHAQGGLQLGAAVAAKRAEGVPRETFGMHPHQHRPLRTFRFSLHDRHVLAAIEFVAKTDRPEAAEGARHGGLRLPAHEAFGVEPVADQVGDRDQPQAVQAGVLQQLGKPRHRTIWVLDLADHTRRIEPRQAGQVHGGLGVAGPFQHAAIAGPQGEDVARSPKVGGAAFGVNGHLDRPCPVVRGDARAHAIFWAGIHAHREGGLIAVGVAIHHQWQIQGIEPLPLHRQADQAPGCGGHEVDL